MASQAQLDAARAYVQQRTIGEQQQQSQTLAQRQTPPRGEETQEVSHRQRQNVLRM